MANSNTELFRCEYAEAEAAAEELFRTNIKAKEKFLDKKQNQLLIKYGFLEGDDQNSGVSSTCNNNSAIDKSSQIVNNFVASCNKYDPKIERMNQFFERLERKFKFENVTPSEKLNILDMLLPGHFYQPYEHALSETEQYDTYKNRALFIAKCTPIDVLYQSVNTNFSNYNSFGQIFAKNKYLISKVQESFPKHELLLLATWIVTLKDIPRSVRAQIANDCRVESLDELEQSLQRFSSNKNRSLCSYFTEFRKLNENTFSNNFKQKLSASTQDNSNDSNQDSKKDNARCKHCSKSGHLSENCWTKFPEKKPKHNNATRNIAHTFATGEEQVFKDGVEFILQGTINNIHSTDILMDTGASIAAFDSKFCANGRKTGTSMSISSLSPDNSMGIYPVVQIPVKTVTVDGIVQGVSVPNLKNDAILPIYKQEQLITLNSLLNEVKVTSNPQTSGNSNSTIEDTSTTTDETEELQAAADPSDLPRTSDDLNVANQPLIDAGNASATTRNSTKRSSNGDISLTVNNSSITKFDVNLLPKALTLELIKSHQNVDLDCRKYLQILKENDNYFLSPQVELKLHNELICKVNSGTDHPFSIFIPKSLIPFFLKHYHDDTGHLSYTAVAKNISNKFYWCNFYKSIQDYINKCNVCQYDTTNRFHKNVPSDLITLTSVPFEHVAIDYITHFDRSYLGNSYLLTIVDIATRFANAIPVKTLTAEECLNKLLSSHFYKFGFPKRITSDNGRQFTSKIFNDFCKDYNIEPIKTSPRHPQSNGVCERFNGTFSDMIKHSCLDDLRSWDENIDKLLFTYNNTVRSGTKFSPYNLILNFDINDVQSRVDSLLPEEVDVTDFVLNNRLDGEDNRRQAVYNLRSSQVVNKARLDKNAVERKFSIGDKVLMKTESSKKSKMKLKWHGPYTVVGFKSDKDYVIEINNQYRSYHIDLLKLYQEDENLEQDNDDVCNSFINSLSYLAVYDKSKNINVVKSYDSPNIKDNVNKLLDKFSEIFSEECSLTNVLSHEIKLLDDTPVKKLPYSVPLAFRDKFKNELDKMLKNGIIEPSNSDYSSPCIIVPKKNKDEIRIVIDYRTLNSRLVKDREPINNVQNIFARINNCKYFSVLDLKNGFWQVPLTNDSKKYTAFTTEFGLYQFKVLPFGIANGPAEFSRLMRNLFCNQEHVFTFLDDILIATDTIETHFEILEKVFTTLKNANLKVNSKKSHFVVETIDFLGQTLSSNYIFPQNEKIQCIQDFPLPENKTQLQSFLGLCNYYRHYVKNFADLTHQLYNLLKKNLPKKLVWTEDLLECFDKLRLTLSSDIKLYQIDQSLPFIVQTDASSYAVGAVLGQRPDPNGPVLPIHCISKKLNETQMRYSTIEREAYAIVWAVEKFSFYLLGSHFIIESDHQPLSYINKYSKSKDKLKRWELLLNQYDYEIKYIPGKENLVSDCLSRLVSEN